MNEAWFRNLIKTKFHNMYVTYEDVILKNIFYPPGCLLDSTRYTFSNGALARNVLACKYLDILYLLSLLMDTHMTRIHLIASGLQRFFLKFDKASGDCYISTDGLKVEGIRPRGSSPLRSIEETY